jgi:hypothetical protein
MAISPAGLVAAASNEWQHWKKCTWNVITKAKSKKEDYANDDDDAYAKYVVDNYLPPFYSPSAKWPTAVTISQDDYAWSAVAMSYFMLQAGFKRKHLLKSKPKPTNAEFAMWVAESKSGEFPISEAHHDYIRWSIRARKDEISSASYWGYRADEPQAVPDVGDLVGYVRGMKGMTRTKALGYFDRSSGYTSHTDVVVAKRPGEIDVIGGNVLDSVCLKTVKTDANGLLADIDHFWFVVMKLR